MSHFSVVVCLDGDDSVIARARRVQAGGAAVMRGAIESRIEAVMAPFSESLEAEPYRDYEEGSPAGYFGVKSFREEGALTADDDDLTWAAVAEAHNKAWADETPLLVDEESGRAYTMSTWNKQSTWDYWRIGGRWGGYFPFRPEHRGLVVQGDGGWDSPDKRMPDHCDGGPKLALDLARLREEKADAARKTWTSYQALVAGTPEAMPWSVFRDNISEGGGYTVEQARTEYHSQPRVQRIAASEDFRWHDDAISQFGQPEKLYVAKETARAVPGYALVTLDGRWMAPGKMGWFGMSSESDSDRIGYWETANAYIEALPDSAILVALDCHV